MPEFAALRRFAFVLAALCLLALGGHVRAQNATPEATALPSLAEQVGFSDAALIEAEARGYHFLNEVADFEAFGRRYKLLDIWERPLVTTDLYFGKGTVLLYQVDGRQPEYVWHRDFDTGGLLPSVAPSTWLQFSPGDWNSDGHIKFTVITRSKMSSRFGIQVYVYELRSDNTVISLLKDVIPRGDQVVAIERQASGLPLLVVADSINFRTMNTIGASVDHYYEWQSGTLIDTSELHLDKYNAQVGDIILRASTQALSDYPAPEWFAADMLVLLQIYEAIHKRQEGWLLVQDLVIQGENDGRISVGTYIDRVFMPAITQLYAAGKPFAAPEYNENTFSAVDFYAGDRN